MRQSWWPRRRCVALAAVLAGAAALTAATAQAQPAMTCDAASFEQLGLPKTRIVSASAVKDDARAGPHCMLRGAVNERTGSDGKPYAIGFEMRLPERWNGRYFDQVNGGNGWLESRYLIELSDRNVVEAWASETFEQYPADEVKS